MKFILKEGLVHIVGNHGLPNNSIEGEIVAPELFGFQISASINSGPYKEIAHKLVIPKEELNKPSIQLTIRAIKDEKVLYFKSDAIPLTHAIIFGKTLEDSYPEVIKVLMSRMENVEKLLNIKEQQIEEHMYKTKDELHEHMLELVDTFEEITKKGSLF